MASQRQYEMLFRLNAQMGSQYNSTFRQAQSSMQQFREEYRNLSSTANDISGYQRQQTAVENTKSKLELLQTQYDNIQREMDETGGFSSDLANKLAAKKAQIDKTTKAYQDQIARLDEYKRRLEEAGVDTTNLDKESDRLKNELKRLKEGFKESGDGAKDFGDKGEEALDKISTMLAAAGIVKMLKEIYDAFAACVQVAGDFEEAMSNVEAISGANAEEIADLTERAKELGASTAFTAQQVSEGMSYMAMAGWKTTDMLDGMDAVLALAAASGEDLGTTSDIVTDALTAFGLTSKDTARFADVLAAASSNANTNVGMMGETFKYAAPVAGALGYSIEDVAIAVGLMANSGIKASQAGTTLRNIFNGFLGDVELSSDAFGDLTISFINSDGSMKSLSESLDILRYYFSQMTEAERVQNAVNLAGQRGYSGLLAILNSTTEDYDKLADAIYNSTGAAQKMADIKLDNMNGQLTIAKSAWEGLQIAVGEQFTPVLQKLYAIAADVLGGITEFVKAHPGVVKAIVAITAGVAAFVVGITAYIAVTKIAKLATEALTAAMNKNPYLMLGSAIAGVVVAVATLVATMSEAEEVQVEYTLASKNAQRELAALNDEYERAIYTYGETSEEAQALKERIDELSEAYGNGLQSVEDFHKEIQDALSSWSDSRTKYEEETQSIDAEYESTIALISKLEALSSTSELAARNQALIIPIIDELNKRYEGLGLTFDSLTGRFNMSTDDIRAVALSKYDAQQAIKDQERYVELIGQIAEGEIELQKAQDDYNARLEEYNRAKAAYDDSNDFWHWIAMAGGDNTLDNLYADRQAAEAAMNEAKDTLDIVSGGLSALYAERDQIEEKYGITSSGAVDPVDRIITSAEAAAGAYAIVAVSMEELAQAYDDAYNAASESFAAQFDYFTQATEISEESVSTILENVQAAQESQLAYWNSYAENIARLKALSAEDLGLTQENYDLLMSYVQDGSESAVTLAAGIVQAIDDGDTAAVTKLGETTAAVVETRNQVADDVAKWQIDFDGQMGEIIESMNNYVTDLNLSDEATTAAEATVNSYVEAIRSGKGNAVSAAKEIARAVADALNIDVSVENGYASGTDYAPPGLAWVGENGPELMAFRGGETVYSASESAAIMREWENAVNATATRSVAPAASSNYTIQFSPVYELSGNADSAEIRAVLAEHDAELLNQMRELLEEEREDAARRAYV